MHFKSLELTGFKSFADKTRFAFEPGVTAIVGPNGCGKSNIADAIQWVLGEQSARTLRGLKMEDVIFSGTEQRKPLGLAEVSLTLAGADEHLPVDYREVTVTRRVFRSGEGEYFINRNPCRLRDITELFIGTGIGLSAYSIIAQGKIEMILSSKPEDRRFIFEEAAGITKYKEKKRQALRKLESTDENLLRLSDIISEVKRQLASVERQAQRARKAKETGDRLKEMEIQFSARQLARIEERIRAIERTRAEARQREQRAGTCIEEFEDEQESLRTQLYTLDRELGSVQTKRVGVAGSIESNRNRVEANERLLREIDKGKEQLLMEMRGLEEFLEALRAESETMGRTFEGAERECGKLGEEIESEERGLKQIRASLRDEESRAQRLRDELVDLANTTARLRNELTTLRGSARSAALQVTRLQVERRELAEKLELAQQALEERRLQREEGEARAGEAGKLLEDVQLSLARARDAAAELIRERIEIEKSLAEYEAQLALLGRYKETREGFEKGAQTILAESEREGSTLRGIAGAVAEKIKPTPEYELALEVALGHALQLLVSETIDDACTAISFLGEKSGASLLPLAHMSSPPELGEPRGEGVLGRARDLVEVEPAFSVAAHHILANTYFVSDLPSALKLIESCRPGVRLATLTGELIVKGGEMEKIGKMRGPSPVISIENEMGRVRALAEKMRAGRDEVRQKIDSAEGEHAAVMASLSGEREKTQRMEIKLAEARSEESRADAALEQIRAETNAVAGEIAEMEKQRRESEHRDRELEREIAQAGREENRLKDSLEGAQREIEERAREQEQVGADVTELKVRFATSRGREKSLHENLERARNEIARTEESLRAKREQMDRSAMRRQELNNEIDHLHTEIKSLLDERDTTDTNAKEREEKKAAIYERQRMLDRQLKEEISRLRKVKDEVAECEVDFAERRAEKSALIGRIREQYSEDLEQATIDEGISDWSALERSIEQFRVSLKRLGPVNMVALEEHRELEERLSFLTEQEEDLLAAKNSLVKAIDKINRETTRMFTETFEKIRVNFKEMFKDLFGGGTADLILEEGADILEAGINIVARPPGKKLQNLSLLSGGERALTAVALLFGIFKIKPSPFCVLDEIDAPLDESNINRFLELLKKFLGYSQFIIVTHNKRTISMADVMYGITMEESGISKVVSVKFGKAGGKRGEEKLKTGAQPKKLYARAAKSAE